MRLEDVGLLRQALPYINKFKGKTFVIKLGGDIAERDDVLHAFCEEVALLAQVGIRIALVHGGGKQATDLSEKLGIQPRIINGRRVTDDLTLDVVKMVFAGQINTEILASLRKAGVGAVGLSGVDGNVIHAQRRPPKLMKVEETGKKELVDFGHVGDIDHVDAKLLRTLLDADFVPVIASLGADEQGNILNINADTESGAIAGALGAEKLNLASDIDGIVRADQTIVSRATVQEIRAFIKDGVIRGGMIPKAESCVGALGDGVGSVHIINGMKPSTLLQEIFTDTGSGTMICR
ncbi:MAG: acetylglutamate kinase [Planctomycetes bacterium]|nr:acetylglutamate kinase [Planctomycetota bacterium]